MNFRIAFLLLFAVAFFCTTPLFSEEQTQGQKQEQSDVLTVVSTELNVPFSFRLPDGTPTGLYIEFWKLWSATNGIPIRFVLVPFEEGLQLIKQKNTLHVGLFRNEEREQWADFSLPIHNVQTGIIYAPSISKKTKLRELDGIKVSTERFTFQESYMRDNYPDLGQSTYNNFDDAFNQLLNNDVQAVIDELPRVFAHLAKKGLSGVFTISEEIIVSNNVFALIAQGQPKLLARINAGIENIPVNKLIELEKKWLPTFDPFFSDGSSLASLTLAERKWLQQLPPLRLGIERHGHPYEYINDEGEFLGISADYIKYIEKTLSLKIEVDERYSWTESLSAIKQNKIDIISSITRTPEREKKMRFTEPYISASTVLVSRKNGFYADSLASLKDRVIGIPFENALAVVIANDHPEITIVTVDSTIDGLKKLSDGEFDAFINDISIINNVINSEKLSDLVITGFSPYQIDVSMAVRSELKPLAGILNKVFLSMSEKEKVAISTNWLSIQIKSGTELSTVALWSLPILSLLMLIIFWVIRSNRVLATSIRDKHQVEIKLKAEKARAEKANHAKDSFLATMSHEIRTPMNAVLGMSQILSESGLTSEQQSNNDILYSSAYALLSLLDDILDLSKIEAGKIELDTHSFTLKDVIDKVIHQQNFLLADKDILLRVDVDSSVRHALKGDSFRLSQILTNLINNAIKFTEQGEIKLSIRTVKTENQGINIEFSITDTGIGMTANEMNSLFDSYIQADSSTTRKYGGTGLGLSICKKLVALMGGDISVVSEANEGSCFTFNAVFGAGEQAEALNDDSDINFLSQTKKMVIDSNTSNKKDNFKEKYQTLKDREVLLVDDNPVNLIVTSSHLKSTGINVTTATNGLEAIDAVKKHHFDAVLMDIRMPIMDGLDASRSIRDDLKLLDLPIIALSANVMADDEEKSFRAGMNAHLGKPIDIESLFSTLSSLILKNK
ncbi:MAG: signal transduction histidine kinase/ActR/RegA family two-component response regulator [Candidatus Azotimanducaceae bacterium]|jgi:signal transduction histidine kinase/ActR/RegA family two-component response regulator